MEQYRFYDLRAGRGGEEIDILFPGWQAGDERLMVLSPHDDDALLGAGYAISAALAHGAEAHVCIYCDGSAGYSVPEDRERIVAVRREETYTAYGLLGLGPEHVHRLELPDFSANQYLGWKLASGGYGVLQTLLPLMRRLRVTRLFVPNGYREHLDHEATYDSGRYDGVQVGDPVLVDLGARGAGRYPRQPRHRRGLCRGADPRPGAGGVALAGPDHRGAPGGPPRAGLRPGDAGGVHGL